MHGVIAALALLLLCASPAYAIGGVGSNDLIEGSQAFDGREVVYSGEVIGDILNAGDHVWLNISDGSNAIGAWTDRSLTSDIQVPGRYGQRGDIVQVTGVFHRACPEHGGDFDIHTKAITLLERGLPVAHDVQTWKVWLAILLTAAAVACAIPVLSRMERKLLARRP